ncbi:MAG: GAF domain-containing protein [Acidobacteriota bacterium]
MAMSESSNRSKTSEAAPSTTDLLARLQQSEAQLGELKLVNQQLQKEIRDLLVIGEVARSITSTLLIEEVLGEILRGIRETLALDRVVLGLVHYEGGYEEVKLGIGVSGAEVKKARWTMDDADPVWKRLKDERMPILVERSREAGLPEFIHNIFPDEFVKAPMVVKGEIIGTIMVSASSRDISTRDMRLLRILVEYAGIAVENGRLYYDVIRSEEELRKTQEQLLDAERLAAIGQLAVSINHEINNPLCTINMSSQLLRLDLEKSAPELIERLDGIENAVQRIMEVTQRVSKMNKLRSTEYLPNQMMIDLK